MSERDPESPAEPRDEPRPGEAPTHPLPQAHPGRHEHETRGEGTMERMLNDALGWAARRIKINPQTGLDLPCPPHDPDEDAARGAGGFPPAIPDPDSAS